MKKRSLYKALVILAALLLAGCGKDKKADTKEPDTGGAVVEKEEQAEKQEDKKDEAPEEEKPGEPEEEIDEEELAEQREQFDRNLESTEETFLNSARFITKFGDKPRILNYAIDVYKPYRRTGDEKPEDIHGPIEAKLDGDVFKRLRYLRADKNGSTIDISVYTDPESLIIDRIMTEEYCSEGREVTDYYFSEGKLCYARRYMNDVYGTAYIDDKLPGKKCFFEEEKMTGCIVDDADTDFKKREYRACDYADFDELSKSAYDELEWELLKRAYITYEAVRSVPGHAVLSGYVGDEYGGYLSNAEITITSKANEYEWTIKSNGDGYFETKVPINTADRYGVVCKYGDYPLSTVDDIDIVPGTLEYSLGVIYVAESGKAVHEPNTYLLNANYTSPKHLGDNEYCVVFDYEDKSADLKPFAVDLKSGKTDSDVMAVIKPGKGKQIKYFVTDQRGGRSGNPMTYEMSTSRAVVKVYSMYGLVASYQVPAGVAGTVWEVFCADEKGIHPIGNYLIECTKGPFF